MAAGINDKFRKKRSNFSTTLSSGINDTVQTIPLTSVAGLATDTAIGLTIDRVDADNEPTPSLMERVIGVLSSNDLTLAVRGADNTTAKSHNNNAVVEDLWDADTWNDAIDGFLVEHDQDGTHDSTLIAKLAGSQTFTGAKTFGSALLLATRPKITTSIDDSNGNEVIQITATSSAVNQIHIINSATGNAVQIAAAGGDTDIDLKLLAKGAGQINVGSGAFQTPQTYSPSAAATATLDLSLGNEHRITMPAGNITIALSNAKVGQKFLVAITQDGTGGRTVTWFSTIRWVGGVTPTLTSTLNKRDVFGFIVTGSGTYDGFIVGQNI